MKSKLFAVPFIALMAIGSIVNAQNTNLETQAKKQVIDNYQAQKQTTKSAFKREMDALNDQKNLTPEQREERKKQIIANYQQQKKTNQETFQQNKEAQKTVSKNEKELEKNKTDKVYKIKEKKDKKDKSDHDNRGNKHRGNKSQSSNKKHN